MKTFIDANVLLETLLEGRQHPAQAAKAIAQAETAVVSPLTVHLYLHFGRKERHDLAELLGDLEEFPVLALGADHVAWAKQHYQDKDFEDALQVACAALEGCDRFITFDSRLAARYDKFIEVTLLKLK
jgi:predicted nucleic acid-binding protein